MGRQIAIRAHHRFDGLGEGRRSRRKAESLVSHIVCHSSRRVGDAAKSIGQIRRTRPQLGRAAHQGAHGG